MKEITEIFLDLVKISSPSRKEKRVADYVKKHLASYSGITVIEDESGEKN